MNDGRDRIEVRTRLKPGDLGEIIRLHGVLYAREYGFDHTFEAYVAGPLAQFAKTGEPRGHIWIAERNEEIVGCIAIVAHSPRVAQLRWFLVHPTARGLGLGKRLIDEAVTFCRDVDYDSVILWTVSALTVAAHLYRAAGFVKVEETPARQWGVDVVEERYELRLRP